MTKPSITQQLATGNKNIDGRLYPTKWAGNIIEYSFPTAESDYGPGYFGTSPAPPAGTFYHPVDAVTQATRAAFVAIESFSGLAINETTSHGTAHVRIGITDTSGDDEGASGEFPDGGRFAGDIWIGRELAEAYYVNYRLGGADRQIVWHEIGHTLGLTHGDQTDSVSGAGVSAATNSLEYSTMSYYAYVGAPYETGADFGSWPQTYMMYDIAALQANYGANYAYNNDNTSYTFSPTTGQMFVNGAGTDAPAVNKIFRTIWDGGGIDTYNFANYSSTLTVDLRPGHWSTTSVAQLADLAGHQAVGNIASALLYHGDERSIIENSSGGSGNDRIIGNQAKNVLHGNDGKDALYGLEGDDHLYGDGGADRLIGGLGRDLLSGGTGDDRLYADGNDSLRGDSGHDTFVFTTTPDRATNDPTIADFTVSGVDSDTVELSHAIYTAVSVGALSASAFVVGSAATNANQHIVYNAANGALSYDADGIGGGAAVQFAKLSPHLGLTAGHFRVVA